ncbi:MAG: hypothetical protein PHO89_08780 [Methylacidiphilaceae bacterium]|nr:hypothetical protein [Candidatus Methylacidiphilaceae bacterium]
MASWLQESEGIAPLLGAGISFPTEWGTLLAILVLFAIQTALAYRRGKVEPLPPGQTGPRRSPARIPEARPDESRPELPRGGEPEAPRVGVRMDQREDVAKGEESLLAESGSLFQAPAPPRVSSRRTETTLPSAVFLQRLRNPIGAREAFLGAEILWNPPVALREPGKASG